MFYNKKYHRVYGENVYPKCQKFLNAQWRKNYGGNSGIFRISPSVRYRKLNPNINLVVSPISFQNSSFVMSRMEFFQGPQRYVFSQKKILSGHFFSRNISVSVDIGSLQVDFVMPKQVQILRFFEKLGKFRNFLDGYYSYF